MSPPCKDQELINSLRQMLGDDVSLRELDQTNLLTPAEEKAMAIYEDLSPKDAIELSSSFNHIIDINDDSCKQHTTLAKDHILKTNSVFNGPVDYFSQVFAPNRTPFQYSFSKSNEKSVVLENLKKYLEGIPQVTRIQNDINLVADELTTNILYNAPASSKENPKIHAIDRKCEIDLNDKNGELICFPSAGKIFLIAIDEFGSFPMSKCLNRLVATFKHGMGQSINFGAGGAGLGLRILYDRSDSILFAVEKWQKTIICITIPLKRDRKKENLPKTIHIIEKKDEQNG